MNQYTSKSYISRTLPVLAFLSIGFVMGLSGALALIKKTSVPYSAPAEISPQAPTASLSKDATPSAPIKKGEPQLLSGTVTAVNGNVITMQSQTTHMAGDTSVDTKIVTLSNDTKILKLTQKSPEDIRMESEATAKMEAPSDGTSTPTMTIPDMFKRENASIADVAIKENIVVTTLSDVSTSKEFLATALDIYTNTTK